MLDTLLWVECETILTIAYGDRQHAVTNSMLVTPKVASICFYKLGGRVLEEGVGKYSETQPREKKKKKKKKKE